MKYILGLILSIIYCPTVSILVTLFIFLKGIWGNGFYHYTINNSLLPLDYTDSNACYDVRDVEKVYLFYIFHWKFVSKWYSLDRWHNV